MAEIKSVSHVHVAIMDYLMSHPTVHLGDVAKHFGYTQPWLSTIIHSDAFQVMLQEKQGIAFHDTVLPIREKMLNAAHQALDKITNLLPTETDVRTVASVADSMLDRLGFGSKPVGGNGNLTINQQNNTLNMITPNANAAEIAAARELLAAKKTALGVIDGVTIPLALPREGFAEVGETVGASDLSSSEGTHAERESGAAV